MVLFRSLASGSSGNAFLLQTEKARVLIDAGLRLPKLEKFLRGEGIEATSLSAVIVSHEHTDHCVAAPDLAIRHGIPIWSNAEVLRALGLQELPQAAVMEVGRPYLFGDAEITCFPVSHDAVRPVGFIIRARDRTITLATDLGQACGELQEAIGLSDLVVLESNHDLHMLQHGRYPYHLRRRVAGPRGHLSNDQAAAILMDHLKEETVDVWLAHLSRENNRPELALRTVRSALDAVGLGTVSVAVAARDRPSVGWTGIPAPRQLSLFASLGAG